MTYFLEMPIIWSLPLFLIVALLSSILIYLISNRAVKSKLGKSHERTGRVLFRTTASLLALLLSFTFANQRVNYYKIKDSLEAEAAQLLDIMVDLQMFHTPEATDIQEKVRHYMRSIIHEDFKTENDNPLLTQSVYIFISLYNNISKMEVTDERQARLKENILTDIDLVSDFMQIRSYRSTPEPLYFIFIAGFGFFVSAILFGVYKPDVVSIVFFSFYNAFVAIVLYFIIMMNNPMIGPLKIDNKPINMVIEIADLPPPPPLDNLVL
ncbi:MAG: hypothetical protein U5K79_03830 [Cyclobacteriaceae bacterium]|nr:hypothetical protein [Cyclobacteriaceae bacterium]